MKKGKFIVAITIALMSFLLVAVMFMQFKTVEQTDITSIETMREAELRSELTSWKSKYEKTKAELDDTNSKINEYKEKIESNQETSELLEKELVQSRVNVGKVTVKGEGIVVTLKNTVEDNVTASNLIDLINELNLAGAEAICINGERVISMTDIVDVNNIIKMNGKRLVAPYEIKAIGNQKYLESALNLKDSGYIDTHPNATLEKQNNVVIPKYSGEMTLKYIEQ